MNRILRRPMFRTGGTAEGITSGLAPRQGYKNAKRVTFDEEKGYNLQELIDAGIYRTGGKEPTVSGNTGSNFVGGGTGTQSIMDTITQRKNILDAMYPRQSRRDTSFNDFLINMGLDLVSRPKGGSIFQQVATSAKEPFGKFQEAKQREEAYRMRETSEDRALLAKMLEGMDEDKLSALMKDVKAGVESGLFPDEATGIKLLLQKKIYGVLDMEGEAENARIREIEVMVSRDQEVPTGMIKAVATHIYKMETNAYPEEVQKDLNRTKTYIKPNHIEGVKRDDDGEVIEIVVNSNYEKTYTSGQIYFDAQTGDLFKRTSKAGEAVIFTKVIFE